MLATSSRISRPCLRPSHKLTRSGERKYTRLAFVFACRDDDYGINCREERWNLCIFHIASSAWSVEINARPEYLPGLNIADLHFRERIVSLIHQLPERVHRPWPSTNNPFQTLPGSTLSFRVNFRVAAEIEETP